MSIVMAGCDEMVFDREHADENMSIARTYGELAGNFGMIPCGKPVVRDGKCEDHKVERRKEFGGGNRRQYKSCDSPRLAGTMRATRNWWTGNRGRTTI